MSADDGEFAIEGIRPEPPRRRDLATAILRTYTRAFLSQSVGVIGLAWCLAANLPLAALGLLILVLIDQVLFLRGRQPLQGATGLQRGLDGWCLLVSLVDGLLFVACLFRASGLREIGGAVVVDPLSCFAFAVAALTHLNIGLMPVTAAGRMLAATLALFGALAFLGGLAALVRAARHTAPAITRR